MQTAFYARASTADQTIKHQEMQAGETSFALTKWCRIMVSAVAATHADVPETIPESMRRGGVIKPSSTA